ncbi:aspartate aminotransferase family protein [Nakamurella leprariae]|uniref:Aspartate aminotransferase family protein n=1 Tax=Nakamurella leprariae TaxID=2803911 RepID=A0A938YIS1_9ACTN|nr:aspartate aminotransferase family protein [Nakamurella leprariae]
MIAADHASAPDSGAADHLWMHFTRMGSAATDPVPVVARGEGAYLFDTKGKRYLDALSGLFVVQAGYGREELAVAADRQLRTLPYFPIWSYATPPAIELADRLAALAPGDLNKVFFSSGGGESVETAWKVAKQYFKLTGRPNKTKVISRAVAYHGTTQGALSITGVPGFKHAFEPLVPGTFRVPNTDFYRAPEPFADDEKAFGRWAADRVEEAILAEGPDSVAAVFVEPVQNAGGSIPPPPGYFERLREICDRHDVLLVSDEVICAYGRLGAMFGAERFGYQPDIITSAKGLTSGYAALGAAIISDRIFEPFSRGTVTFPHGYTFGGHPVACAVALANLDLFERDDLLGHVRRHEDTLRRTLEQLLDLPIVGDVRGAGYFWSVELVRDRATKEPFSRDDCERILRGVVAPGMWEAGVYCRCDDRGNAVVQFAPPLICGPAEFDQIEAAMRTVLTDAWAQL